nr:hypothetical protein [Alphaproteobacteria bacterium]
AGMPGRSLTLATEEDGNFLVAVEKLIGKPIPRYDPGDRTADNPPKDRAEPATGKPTIYTPPHEAEDASVQADREKLKRRGQRSNPNSGSRRPSLIKDNEVGEEQRSSRHRRSGRERNGRKEESLDDKKLSVTGLGDHVPAFLTRDTKRKK